MAGTSKFVLDWQRMGCHAREREVKADRGRKSHLAGVRGRGEVENIRVISRVSPGSISYRGLLSPGFLHSSRGEFRLKVYLKYCAISFYT